MADLAVVILTRNEEHHLPRSLASVASLARQVFVVDSYSTDSTVAIAQASGAHVEQHPFQNQARQFQWAMDHLPITAQWVLRLDADEVIEPDLAQEIESRLGQLPEEVTGVHLRRKTIFKGKCLRWGGRRTLTMLRIWRHGAARIEDRWMDEHMVLRRGRAVTFFGGFADDNRNDLTHFTDKHNHYASREALDVLNQRLGLWPQQDLSTQSTAVQAKVKRWAKEKLYNRLPFECAAVALFLYRYIVRAGFLDGRLGLTYHVLQCFWYRFLVGAKLREMEAALRGIEDREEQIRVLEAISRQRLDHAKKQEDREPLLSVVAGSGESSGVHAGFNRQ